MLTKLGLLLLIGWSIGAVGLYQPGAFGHVLLLFGLLLLLLGFARARDTATRSRRDEPPAPR